MTEKFRRQSAIILLICYVPVVLMLGFLHKHEPIAPSSNKHHVVYNTFDTHSLTQPVSNFCLACHFASGHVFASLPILGLAHDGHQLLLQISVHYLYSSLIHLPSKRAPPVLTII
ncbi:MAG TPA: hypothetical protein VJ991_03650 [Balneolales bacterium]|nr:hypothetical protein [Balneolales bacterium]